MESIVLFLILSIFIYFVIDRTVTKITNTPPWLLWLALMIPSFVWLIWELFFPEGSNPPAPLIYIPLIISPIIYIWLIQKGKPKQKEEKKIDSKLPLNPMTKPDLPDLNPENIPMGYKKDLPRPINAEEEKALKDCFPWGVYYLQKIDYLPQAIVCVGKLRTEPEKAYPTVKKNLERVFNDRFLVVFQETMQGKPFFALVPNPYSEENKAKQAPEKLTKPLTAIALLLLTLITTTIIGAEISGVSVEELERDFSLVLQGLPYSLCLLGILGIHELSHYLFAVFHRIKTTLPYFIPLPFFLGTFGAFISIKSPMPHRKAVFDVALAGPVGGFLVTIPVLVWGLIFSRVVPMAENASMLDFNALDPRFSLIFAVISKIIFGSQLGAGDAIALHPAAVAGYIGLIITALNLMPVGQLDGGHIVHAMFGQGKAVAIGQIARLLVILLAFIRPEFLLWAIILIFMPIADQPALNDVTELDNTRDFLGLMSLLLLIFILFPVPPIIAQLINI
ncbi:site-2 protease family protein [Cyanobacterium stanieri LEGE 03274]|uniref:Site-2 protease family protein n=1 Tax=Cyanobacterium stanieri LEGE 03274 TaxID=1828756 RepID=A0ABR9V7C7_9CHRO|nr:site-2 protease family protein [Cyanobacterium stanieri]MBE9222739.1 site-2 protease family protein [Cyanobacterium stanieri LEGE 03274]